MPHAIGNAEGSDPSEAIPVPRRLTDPPEWCGLFLDELFRQAIKHARCNVQLACDLSGVTKQSAYEYRTSLNGRWFRIAWDLIVLDARRLHSKQH